MTAFALTVAAAVLGAMLFFVAVLAPTVFTALPAAEAGRFLRALFPRYYLAVLVATAVAAAAAALGGAFGASALLAAIAAGFSFARFVLMPRINAFRDRSLAGDAGAGARFDRLHRASVALNGVQMLALAAVVWLAA